MSVDLHKQLHQATAKWLTKQPLSAIEYWEKRDKDRDSRDEKFPPIEKNFLNCMEFAEDYADYICKFEKMWNSHAKEPTA